MAIQVADGVCPTCGSVQGTEGSEDLVPVSFLIPVRVGRFVIEVEVTGAPDAAEAGVCAVRYVRHHYHALAPEHWPAVTEHESVGYFEGRVPS